MQLNAYVAISSRSSDRSFGRSGRISATHPWADGPTQVEVLGHGTRLRKAAESIHAADGTGISIRLVKIISVMLGKIAETAEYFAQVCADFRAMYDTVLTMVGATAAPETCSCPLRCDQVLIGSIFTLTIAASRDTCTSTARIAARSFG